LVWQSCRLARCITSAFFLQQPCCTGFAYGECLSFASPKDRTKEKAPPDRLTALALNSFS
jgi:hypothetical protein